MKIYNDASGNIIIDIAEPEKLTLESKGDVIVFNSDNQIQPGAAEIKAPLLKGYGNSKGVFDDIIAFSETWQVKTLKNMKDFPRRNRIDLNSPAELAIRKAVEEVEKVSADTRVTDAIVKLNEALNLVADFMDVNPHYWAKAV